jgi:hypothetical protein
MPAKLAKSRDRISATLFAYVLAEGMDGGARNAAGGPWKRELPGSAYHTNVRQNKD